MGGMWFTVIEFAANISEIVGHKSGVALSRNRLIKLSEDDGYFSDIFRQKDENQVRVRSEEVEFLIGSLLYKVGHLDSPDVGMSSIRLYHKYKHSEEELKIFSIVHELFSLMLPKMIEGTIQSGNKAMDPGPFMEAAAMKAGKLGLDIAMELLLGLNRDMETSPWTVCRRQDWSEIIDLEGLFRSESLNTQYGSFFDQRYIDYLNRNFYQIGDIHWRKFEGLTAEYFEREGFLVDIGSGRGDGGIDVRIWPAG